MSSTDARDVPDRCPGALTMHQAADGGLARVRLPGGRVRPDQLLVLAHAATELGDGKLELTSRANVQFRGITDGDRLAERLAAADLLPSVSHERVRNILASPLSGRVGGLADIGGLIDRLDRELCARPSLAELPGRTLFALDDGRGDVTASTPDFGVHALAAEEFALVLAGADTGVRVDTAHVVEVLLDAAQAFVDIRESEWRLAELIDGPSRTLTRLGLVAGTPRTLESTDTTPPIGWLTQDDGRVALGGALALGVLEARLAEFLAAIDRPIVVTPWRGIIVCDLDEGAAEQVVRVLAPMGLIFDASSPWVDLSACTGSPGCEKSNADVRGDLTDAVDRGQVPQGRRQHWSGCERRCGRPKGDVLDVVAGPTGYRVS
ncbi:precorrin-3B synthase [Rhodococcoides yunnanense]|uniref:precorrin-3B synthase n=1 Tax=Rhodococcoides yunnanense TaxID=278209 RepID=UPI000934B618|nr:precorrin-3B synthase [Rhodococcus yunnanensis]